MKKLDAIIIKDKMWTKDLVKDLLLRNDKAVYRALTLLYSFQTMEEKIESNAQAVNGKGFSKFDSKILSSFAEQILAGKNLSKGQLEVARKRVIKYSNQIFNHMKGTNNAD